MLHVLFALLYFSLIYLIILRTKLNLAIIKTYILQPIPHKLENQLEFDYN